MDTKTCTKCGETKALTEFCKDGSKLRAMCRPCWATYMREWRNANLEKSRAIGAASYARRAEAAKATSAKWHAANPDKVKAIRRRANAASRARLAPFHIADILGIPVKELTPELLELKRQKIELHRLQRQLQATLKDLNHDRRDAEPADQCHLADLGDLDHG